MGLAWETSMEDRHFYTRLHCSELLTPRALRLLLPWNTEGLCISRPSGRFKDTQMGCRIHIMLFHSENIHYQASWFMSWECARRSHWSQISNENHSLFIHIHWPPRKSRRKSVTVVLSVGTLEQITDLGFQSHQSLFCVWVPELGAGPYQIACSLEESALFC